MDWMYCHWTSESREQEEEKLYVDIAITIFSSNYKPICAYHVCSQLSIIVMCLCLLAYHLPTYVPSEPVRSRLGGGLYIYVPNTRSAEMMRVNGIELNLSLPLPYAAD